MNRQSQAIYVHKEKFKQHMSILEDGAIGEKVGDIEKINVKNLFKIFLVMKPTFKIIFSQLLLCITFDDRF